MNVKRMYNELIATSLILNFMDSLLTAGAVFAVGYFIAYFYRQDYLFAVIAAGVFFIASLIYKIKSNKILILEKSYPNLKERLRTSFEHQEVSNTVINDLHSDILGMMKKVDINAFLSSKEIVIRLSIIFIMLGSILYFSSIGLDALAIKNTIIGSKIFKSFASTAKAIFDDTREQTDQNYLDKPRLISSGSEDMNISIETYNTELDITEITDPEKNDFGGHYPEEVAGASQEAYEEKIPEEYKDTVEEYFKKINE